MISFHFPFTFFSLCWDFLCLVFSLSSIAWGFDGQVVYGRRTRGTNTGLSCSIRFSSQIPFFSILQSYYPFLFTLSLCVHISLGAPMRGFGRRNMLFDPCVNVYKRKSVYVAFYHLKKLDLDGYM